MNPTDPVVVVQAVLLWYYNIDYTFQFEVVYGRPLDWEDPWCKEKLHTMRSGLTRWWGELGVAQQRKLVDAALERYGDEATRRVAAGEEGEQQ